MNTDMVQRLQDPQILRRHFINDRQSLPTRRVWRGTRPANHLQTPAQELSSLTVPYGDGRSVPLADLLAEAASDALLIMHRGVLIHEQYLHSMQPQDTHLTASVSKSVVSLVAETLLRQGLLSRTERLAYYVPELSGTAFGEASINQLLHMTTAVTYEGRPFNKELEARKFFEAVGMVPRSREYSGPRTLLERLATARSEQPAGEIFRYENGNTEAVGEAIRRVAGADLSQLTSELLWTSLGAQEDAYFGLDSTGRELASGRFSCTARDLVRLGELLRCHGSNSRGEQVLDEKLVADITRIPHGPAADVLGSGDTRAAEATLAYHNFWWLPLAEPGSFVARGRSGQRLYVNPNLELVAVHFGSQPVHPEAKIPNFEQAFAHIGREFSS